jgi:hypothetical protein
MIKVKSIESSFTRQVSIQRWRLQNRRWELNCDCFAFEISREGRQL